MMPVWEADSRLGNAPATAPWIWTKYGVVLGNPGSSTATGVDLYGVGGYHVTPGDGVGERSANSQILVPGLTVANTPTPPASFMFTLANVPSSGPSGAYHTVLCIGGGMWWTGGWTPWDILVYRRDHQEGESHRMAIYNRNTSTLYGDGWTEQEAGFSLGAEWLVGALHHILIVWDENDDLSLYIDGTHRNTKAASGAWQTGTVSTTTARFFRAPGATSTEYDYAGDMYFAAVWDRGLSQAEAELMTRDPYGLIRRDVRSPSALPLPPKTAYVWG